MESTMLTSNVMVYHGDTTFSSFTENSRNRLNCSCSESNTDNYTFETFRNRADFILGIICLSLIPLICAGNFLVLISLWKFRQLRTITNTLIGNLSVADSMLALLTLPVYAYFYFHIDGIQSETAYKYLCLFKFSSVACSMSASLINLVAIAFDRYIAILHPLQYKTIVTFRRVRIFILCMWFYLLIICVTPFLWNNYNTHKALLNLQCCKKDTLCDYFKILPLPYTIYAAFFSITVCLIVTLYIYIRIYAVARRQQKLVRKDSIQLSHNGTYDKKQMERDTKSAKVMALILFLFYIFWTPFSFMGPLKYLDINDNLAETLKNITLTLAMSNSAINPIIYCGLRRDFKVAFKRIFTDLCFREDDFSGRKRKESLGNLLLSNTNSIELEKRETHAVIQQNGSNHVPQSV